MLPPPARGPGTLIPSAQRLVWAAKQPLGKAALGPKFRPIGVPSCFIFPCLQSPAVLLIYLGRSCRLPAAGGRAGSGSRSPPRCCDTRPHSPRCQRHTRSRLRGGDAGEPTQPVLPTGRHCPLGVTTCPQVLPAKEETACPQGCRLLGNRKFFFLKPAPCKRRYMSVLMSPQFEGKERSLLCGVSTLTMAKYHSSVKA